MSDRSGRVDPLDRVAARHDRALAHLEARRFTAARRDALAAHRGFIRHAGPKHPDVAGALDTLAMIDLAVGDHIAAVRRLRRAVVILGALRRIPEVRPLLAQSVTRLGEALRERGLYAEARSTLTRAVRLTTTIHGRRSMERAAALTQLGMVCKFAGWFARGVGAYTEALTIAEAVEPRGELVKALLHNLAGIEHARDRFADAERWGRRGVALRRETDGDDHPGTELDLGNLAPVLVDLGQLDEAETILRRLVDAFSQRYGQRHYEVAVVCHNLAAVLAARGQLDEAASFYRRALSIKRARLGPSHPDLPITQHNLAATLHALGRWRAASRLWRTAFALARKTLGPRHPTTLACAEALRP